MSYSSPLIKNVYEQWVYTYMTILSEPMYKLQQGYCEYVSYDAWRLNLYTIPKPDNRTIAQEGWVSFVKGIQSMYQIYDFRAGCTKAKQIIVSRHERKHVLDLWTALPRESLAELKKVLEDAEKDAFHTYDRVWYAKANVEESTMDYNRMTKELEEQERIMNTEKENLKEAREAWNAAEKVREAAKKAVEAAAAAAASAAAATEAPPAVPAVEEPKPSCDLPFTDNKFKSLKPCKATLVPGTYYIGDPCYPLGDSWIYKKAWDDTGYKVPAYFHTEKGVLIVGATAWGDGSYHEDHEFKDEKSETEYLVDSGTISIISVALIVDEVKRLALEGKPQTFESLIQGGHMHTFKNEVDVEFKDGAFTFDSGDYFFTIDTDYCKTCCEETDDEESDDE
jgi:hypothetical protein